MNIFAHIVFSGQNLQSVIPIAIALRAETGQSLYCEFNDFKDSQLDPFDNSYIVPTLRFGALRAVGDTKNLVALEGEDRYFIWGNTDFIRKYVSEWIGKFHYNSTIIINTANERIVAKWLGVPERYAFLFLPVLAEEKQILDSNWTWFLPIRRRAMDEQPNQYDPLVVLQSKIDFYNYLMTK